MENKTIIAAVWLDAYRGEINSCIGLDETTEAEEAYQYLMGLTDGIIEKSNKIQNFEAFANEMAGDYKFESEIRKYEYAIEVLRDCAKIRARTLHIRYEAIGK